jgi:DNA-binding MarR family transcriptional regulator
MPSFPNTDFITSLGPAFLARRLRALSDQFVDDIQVYLTEQGVQAPARGLSTVMLIATAPGTGVTQLAEKLGFSHPLMINLLSQLEKLGLVRFQADSADKRRRLVYLTREGEAEVSKLKSAIPAITAAYASLSQQAGHDLWAALEDMSRAMQEKPYLERLRAFGAGNAD